VTGLPERDDHGLELERSLTERARDDREAFAELYRAHVGAVYAFAHRVGGSREVAEEATSATFERALRSIATFEWRGGGIRPWLYRIAANEATEIHRRNGRARSTRGQAALRALATGEGQDPAQEVLGLTPSADIEALRQALAEIHPRYRDAIALRYLGELSADEAASALGCSTSVLAVTLHRALGALRRALHDHVEASR
jgi:RNA polymerase sigma-70 factor (ECF subfamily)